MKINKFKMSFILLFFILILITFLMYFWWSYSQTTRNIFFSNAINNEYNVSAKLYFVPVSSYNYCGLIYSHKCSSIKLIDGVEIGEALEIISNFTDNPCKSSRLVFACERPKGNLTGRLIFVIPQKNGYEKIIEVRGE